ncbi:MAG: hypothetical protein GY884_25290 [Proteobacteria bacterium]|nr:hypothetical protein [Pseudomonadota bacterium]
MAEALAAHFEGVTTCNELAGATVEQRKCGTTNVQGRQLNGSKEPCEEAAETASGRFLHLEQSSVVRQDLAGVVAALGAI